VYTGGRSEDHLTRAIESALTVKDEFGRIMTPKERWRQLNYECVRWCGNLCV
jgi:U4/U6.U5 tri-snRNP-associated protein 1